MGRNRAGHQAAEIAVAGIWFDGDGPQGEAVPLRPTRAKTHSCRTICERFDRGFRGQSSYAALSVSESQRQPVYEYIASQEGRHKRVDFASEYVSLLKRNEIRFDLERLWKSEIFLFDAGFPGLWPQANIND